MLNIANLSPGATLSYVWFSCQHAYVLWQLNFNRDDIVDSISKYCETNRMVGMHHELRSKLGSQLMIHILGIIFCKLLTQTRITEST